MKHVSQIKHANGASLSVNKNGHLAHCLCCTNKTAHKRDLSAFNTLAHILGSLFERFYTTIYTGVKATLGADTTRYKFA